MRLSQHRSFHHVVLSTPQTRMNSMLKIATPSFTRRGLLTSLVMALFTVGCSRQDETVPVDASALLPECTIAASEAGSDIVVKVTVANHSQSQYRLLEWNLPKNGELTTALFEITWNGSAVEYRGRMVKREVTAASYTVLASAHSLRAEMSLLQAYAVSSPGRYSITYKAFNQRNDSSGIDTLISNTVTLVKH